MDERAKRPRGRPPHARKYKRQRVKLSVIDPTYDAYAIQSALTGVPIVTLMKRIVEAHAPVIVRGPEIPKV